MRDRLPNSNHTRTSTTHSVADPAPPRRPVKGALARPRSGKPLIEAPEAAAMLTVETRQGLRPLQSAPALALCLN
jgi:hypothetical protein